MKDFEKTVMSQFSNSPTIMGILSSFNDAMTIDQDVLSFYNKYFDLETATDGGLDTWGKIVGVNRELQTYNTGDVIGFDYPKWEIADRWFPFSQAPWFGGGDAGLTEVDDEVFRRLIIAKAAANISNGTIPDLNRFLRIYSSNRGTAYAIDNYDMTVTYQFNYRIDQFDTSILTNNNIAPSIAGVTILLKTLNEIKE